MTRTQKRITSSHCLVDVERSSASTASKKTWAPVAGQHTLMSPAHRGSLLDAADTSPPELRSRGIGSVAGRFAAGSASRPAHRCPAGACAHLVMSRFSVAFGKS